MKGIRIGFAFFMLVMATLVLSTCFTNTSSALTGGDDAPDFRVEAVEGEDIVLSDIIEHKKAVLVFWASWCPHCVDEVPDIEKFYQEKGENAAVVAINVQESKAKVEAFIKKMEISYPVALDNDGSVAQLYEVRGVPTIVVVDKNSKVVYYGHSIEDMTRRMDF